jgi:hypothetical protein
MLNSHTVVRITLRAFGEVSLKLGCRILVAVDLENVRGWTNITKIFIRAYNFIIKSPELC